MAPGGSVIAVGLIVGLVAAAMPSSAAGEQRHRHHGARRGSDGFRHHDFRHRDFRHHDRPGLRAHHHHFRPFVTYYAPPSVVYYTYYTPPPVYYAPPVVYQAPPAYPPAPAVPRVIHYPTGRYELHGDGVTTPYEWAWIPRPPPAPPPPVEPPPVTPQRAPEPPARSGSREAFRWTDDDGVTTWTDRLDNVPERYRARVQRQL